ncbi:MAG: hypothetical protein GWP18_03380 [Proteobacteria bacterium]|nr:hypothetical protein [Pseudomonadota bacterium]
MRRSSFFLSFALVLVACSPVASAPSTTQPTLDTTTTTVRSAEDICTTGDLAFTEDGLVAALGADEGDATQVDAISWVGAGSCERVTIGFTNEDGAPATTLGPTGVALVSFSGIVRIVLADEVETTAVADSLIGGALIERIYVVRLSDSSLGIEIHGVDGTPITARAITTTSPGSLIIDVATSDNVPLPVGVTSSATAVVLSPVPGPNLYPVVVDGYAEPSLRSLRIQLEGDDGAAQDISFSLDGGRDAWQAFRVVIPDGPSGGSTLFVGSIDANDQRVDGATVSIDLP